MTNDSTKLEPQLGLSIPITTNDNLPSTPVETTSIQLDEVDAPTAMQAEREELTNQQSECLQRFIDNGCRLCYIYYVVDIIFFFLNCAASFFSGGARGAFEGMHFFISTYITRRSQDEIINQYNEQATQNRPLAAHFPTLETIGSQALHTVQSYTLEIGRFLGNMAFYTTGTIFNNGGGIALNRFISDRTIDVVRTEADVFSAVINTAELITYNSINRFRLDNIYHNLHLAFTSTGNRLSHYAHILMEYMSSSTASANPPAVMQNELPTINITSAPLTNEETEELDVHNQEHNGHIANYHSIQAMYQMLLANLFFVINIVSNIMIVTNNLAPFPTISNYISHILSSDNQTTDTPEYLEGLEMTEQSNHDNESYQLENIYNDTRSADSNHEEHLSSLSILDGLGHMCI